MRCDADGRFVGGASKTGACVMEQTEKLDKLVASVNEVVRANAGTRVNGKVAAFRTQEYTGEVMRDSCRRLHQLGFYLEDCRGFGEKHITALVRDWHRRGLVAKTMQNQYSRVKIFCGWLGKPGIVNSTGVGVAAYLPEIDANALKVLTVTQKSKSWSGNGLDVIKLVKLALAEDTRFGIMALMGLAFGLRKKEQLRLKPWQCDKGSSLEITDNMAKGGRYRSILFETGEYGDLQRWCLDKAKAACRKSETLGWPRRTYEQNEDRYYHFASKLGFTKESMGICMHGLRAEYAENLAMLRGLIPPSLGGSIKQMSPEQRVEITQQVSEKLGHTKIHTIGAYYGSFRQVPRTDGIGQQIGVIIIDAQTNAVGLIHVNPPVIRALDQTYRQKSEAERRDTVVTIHIQRDGQADEKVMISAFIAAHPQLSERVASFLNNVGLGEEVVRQTPCVRLVVASLFQGG
jgi:hypothetical protein